MTFEVVEGDINFSAERNNPSLDSLDPDKLLTFIRIIKAKPGIDEAVKQPLLDHARTRRSRFYQLALMSPDEATQAIFKIKDMMTALENEGKETSPPHQQYEAELAYLRKRRRKDYRQLARLNPDKNQQAINHFRLALESNQDKQDKVHWAENQANLNYLQERRQVLARLSETPPQDIQQAITARENKLQTAQASITQAELEAEIELLQSLRPKEAITRPGPVRTKVEKKQPPPTKIRPAEEAPAITIEITPLFEKIAAQLRQKGVFQSDLSDQDFAGLMRGVVESLVSGQEKVKASITNISVGIENQSGTVSGIVQVEKPIKASIGVNCVFANDTPPGRIKLIKLDVNETAGFAAKITLKAFNFKGKAEEALRDPNLALTTALTKQLESKGIRLTQTGFHFKDTSLSVSLRGEPIKRK